MYASRFRCDSPSLSTLATRGVPSSSSARYTSPIQPPPIGRALFRRSPRCASTHSATILSATLPQMPLADVLQETLRCFLYEIQHMLELVGTAGVRIWYLALR